MFDWVRKISFWKYIHWESVRTKFQAPYISVKNWGFWERLIYETIMIEAPLLLANVEDEHKGWIRISEELRGGIENESYIKVCGNGRTIFTQVRGTPRDTKIIIRMNEYYRNKLGWSKPPGTVRISIKKVRILGKMTAISSHPDSIVRIGFGLGCISVGLGFLGACYAGLSPSIRLVLSSDFSNRAWGIAGSVVSFLFVCIAVFSIAKGIRALIR